MPKYERMAEHSALHKPGTSFFAVSGELMLAIQYVLGSSQIEEPVGSKALGLRLGLFREWGIGLLRHVGIRGSPLRIATRCRRCSSGANSQPMFITPSAATATIASRWSFAPWAL